MKSRLNQLVLQSVARRSCTAFFIFCKIKLVGHIFLCLFFLVFFIHKSWSQTNNSVDLVESQTLPWKDGWILLAEIRDLSESTDVEQVSGRDIDRLIRQVLRLRQDIKMTLKDQRNFLHASQNQVISQSLSEDRSVEYLEMAKEALGHNDKSTFTYALGQASQSAFTSLGIGLYEISRSFSGSIEFHRELTTVLSKKL